MLENCSVRLLVVVLSALLLLGSAASAPYNPERVANAAMAAISNNDFEYLEAIATAAIEGNETIDEVIVAEPPAANATEMAPLTVCSGQCEYARIQDAIEAADPGAVIEVHSGIYAERLKVTKPLTLKGVNTGGGMPVVDAGGNGSAIILSADGVVVQGLYFTGAGPWPDSGITVTANDAVISGVHVWNNEWAGIYLKNCANNTILGCLSSNNGNDGILFYYADDNTIIGNIVGNNADDGMQFLNSHRNLCTGNVVSNNAGDGITIDTSERNEISGNNINKNDRGIWINASEIEGIGINTFCDNNLKILSVV